MTVATAKKKRRDSEASEETVIGGGGNNEEPSEGVTTTQPEAAETKTEVPAPGTNGGGVHVEAKSHVLGQFDLSAHPPEKVLGYRGEIADELNRVDSWLTSLNQRLSVVLNRDSAEPPARMKRPRAVAGGSATSGKKDEGEGEVRVNLAERSWVVFKAAGAEGCDLKALTAGVLENGYQPRSDKYDTSTAKGREAAREGFSKSLYHSGLRKLLDEKKIAKHPDKKRFYVLTSAEMKKDAYAD